MISARIFAVVFLAAVALLTSCNPLASRGVSYETWSGESPTWKHVKFYLQVGDKRIAGPEVIGTMLTVEYNDEDKDGTPEIIVRSKSTKSYYVIIKLLTDAENDPYFEIIKQEQLYIHYPPAGIIWP